MFQRGPEENARLAEEVYQRLNAHKADNPSMGEVRDEWNHWLLQFFLTLWCQHNFYLVEFISLILSGFRCFCGFWDYFHVHSFFSYIVGPFSFAHLSVLADISFFLRWVFTGMYYCSLFFSLIHSKIMTFCCTALTIINTVNCWSVLLHCSNLNPVK